MKKKKIIFLLILAAVIVVGIVGSIFLYEKKQNKNDNIYVLFNNGLYLDTNIVFYENELKVNAISLGEEIGTTNEGKQVFEIKDMNKEEWICMRVHGDEYVYRNADISLIADIEEFDISRLELLDDNGKEVILKTDEKNILDEIVSTMNDENIISGELIAKQQNMLVLYSDKLPGLTYNLYYVLDYDNNAYLYDNASDMVWKLKNKIFETEE